MANILLYLDAEKERLLKKFMKQEGLKAKSDAIDMIISHRLKLFKDEIEAEVKPEVTN